MAAHSSITEQALIKQVPTAFISYSWDTEEHREWVAALGGRLRSDGIDLLLDEWHLRSGDQLPHFMEKAIRESDFVLIIATPEYKRKSDARAGGVGYEGNIISAEMLSGVSDRKFVPILREGDWREASPSWLLGKFFIDLRGKPYAEANYEQLISTIYGILPEAPSVQLLPRTAAAQQLAPEAVTRQRAYADLVNASLRVLQAAQNRIILKERDDRAAQMLLPSVEEELERQGARVDDLGREIDLFSSEKVRKAAGELAGWVLLARVSATVPPGLPASRFGFLEEKLQQARKGFISEALPKFRAAIRREVGLR